MRHKRWQIGKRNTTFWISDLSLTSRRVSIILNSKEDSVKLVKAVRTSRSNSGNTFTLSEGTSKKIKEESGKLETA